MCSNGKDPRYPIFRKTIMRCILLSLLCVAVSLVTFENCAVHAASRSWNAGTGNWSTGANWTVAGVPAAGDTVSIGPFATGVARTVTYDYTGAAVTLNSLAVDLTGAGTTTTTLAMSANNLTSTFEYVGYNGRGTFEQSGGTNTIAAGGGYLDVGVFSGASGIYNLSGSGNLTANTNEYVGDIGTGLFHQTGGTNTIVGTANNLYLGFNASGTGGTYTLDAGTLSVAGSEYVSYQAVSNFSQNGGMNSASNLYVGANGASGTYSLGGGGALTVGDSQLGNSGTGSSGTVTVTDPGSQWTVNNSLLVLKGSLTIKNQGLVYVGSDVSIGSAGIINLNGGTLRLSTVNSGLPLLQFTAGTLQLAGDRTFGSDAIINSKFGTSPVIPSGKILTVEGTATIPAATNVQLSGGALLAGTVLMSPGSRITATQSSVVGGPVIVPAGAIVDATGGDLILGNVSKVDGVYCNGKLQVGTHTLTLADANDAVLDSAALATLGSGVNPGTLTSNNGLTLDFGGNITGFGTVSTPNNVVKPLINNGHITGNVGQPITLPGYVKGVGTFDNVSFTGTFSPGLSPTLLTVGSISLAPSSTLVMELGGTTPGSGHDQIVASGELDFGGTLQVALINGFTPAAGQSFNLFDWGAVSGTFNTLSLPTLAGLTWNTSQLYTNGVLSLVSTGVPGDYNANGVVDAADYVVWRDNQGTTHALPNDPIGGTIGSLQYDQWRAHFGQTAGRGTSATANVAVPEPASLLLLAAAASAICVRRRDRI
jgi:T5SS/PEP-CTERM-associated repeat protein